MQEDIPTTPEHVLDNPLEQAAIAPQDSAFYIGQSTQDSSDDSAAGQIAYGGLSDTAFSQRPELFLAATFFSGVVVARLIRRLRSR